MRFFSERNVSQVSFFIRILDQKSWYRPRDCPNFFSSSMTSLDHSKARQHYYSFFHRNFETRLLKKLRTAGNALPLFDSLPLGLVIVVARYQRPGIRFSAHKSYRYQYLEPVRFYQVFFSFSPYFVYRGTCLRESSTVDSLAPPFQDVYKVSISFIKT